MVNYVTPWNKFPKKIRTLPPLKKRHASSNAKPNTAQFMPFKQPLNQHELHTAQREKKKGNEQAMYA